MQIQTTSLLTTFLPDISYLARQAGEAIMSIYYSDFRIATKSDGSPVTTADQVAERLIVDSLRRMASDIPVVAEEEMSTTKQWSDVSAGLFWLVDSLDGTKGFVQRNGEFTVNIALIKNHRPILGVIYVPTSGHLYTATIPGVALVEKGGVKRPLHVCTLQAKEAVVVASRQHDDPELLKAFLHNRGIQYITYTGSSLKLCLVAAGHADFYPRFSQTMEWDTAAGHAILNAAGGSIYTIEGRDLHYGKPGFYNPPFIAYGVSPF